MAAGTWTDEWKVLKKDFTTKTGKKKPAATVTNIIGKSNLSPTLKKCDAAYTAGVAAKTNKKRISALSDMTKHHAAFSKLATSYCNDVQNAMIKAGKDKVLMNELDILRKKLQSIMATMASKISGLDAQIKKLNIFEKMARDMRVDLTGALKRGQLFAAKIKADPSWETWNYYIKDAARDITQQIGNVEKIRAKGHDIPGIPQKNASAIFKLLTPYASEEVKYTAETDPAIIKAEGAKYLKYVQATAKWMST